MLKRTSGSERLSMSLTARSNFAISLLASASGFFSLTKSSTFLSVSAERT